MSENKSNLDDAQYILGAHASHMVDTALSNCMSGQNTTRFDIDVKSGWLNNSVDDINKKRWINSTTTKQNSFEKTTAKMESSFSGVDFGKADEILKNNVVEFAQKGTKNGYRLDVDVSKSSNFIEFECVRDKQ
jgi:hypothetical protein